jgi:pimeloyl-ACP methyl ester carboxylesterase
MGYAQSHLTRHLQMKVRFGQWKAILQADEPATSLTHANALWVYARGRALAATGDVGGATLLLKRLRASAAAARHSPLRMEFNSSDAILAVAAEVLAGYIAAASHDHAAAIAHLRGAVTLEDALTYGEPPEWSIPVRQDLGAILLQAGRKEEAAAVFLEDLRRFPDNVWSASGLELATGVPATSRSTALVDAPDRYFVRREVSIRYREIGRGAPVVLLHGYTDRVEMWTAMADSLASHHRVIVPDIRGFGKSSKFARTADYGRAMFADVVALLDHLSIPRAHLVGYSMGAVLAANLAVEHPQRVISASLLAGPFWPDSAGMARDLSPHLAALKRGEGLASFFRFIVPTWPDSLVRAGAAYYYAENDSASLVASIEAFPGLMLDSARVARLRAPALAIIGADDRSLLHASDRIARWWPGARHVVLPRGDHTDIFQLPETIAEVRSMVRQPR